MSIAHFFGFKYPLLFVYYDTPYYAYQDKIISFAVMAYVALFYMASKDRKNVPAALIVLGITVIGLVLVNLSNDLRSVMTGGQSMLPYWLQTAFIALYLIILTFIYKQDKK
jgi:hypothetical protein